MAVLGKERKKALKSLKIAAGIPKRDNMQHGFLIVYIIIEDKKLMNK